MENLLNSRALENAECEFKLAEFEMAKANRRMVLPAIGYLAMTATFISFFSQERPYANQLVAIGVSCPCILLSILIPQRQWARARYRRELAKAKMIDLSGDFQI